MTESAPKKQATLKTSRRWFVAGLIFAILLVGGWQVVEHYVINVEQYRPRLEAELEKVTGLPATIGEMDLRIAPSPRLAVSRLTVGEDDFRGEAEDILVTARMSPLFAGRIELDRIEAKQVRITLPPAVEAFRGRWAAFLAGLGRDGAQEDAQPETESGGRIRIHEIALPDVRVEAGGQALARGSATLRDVLEDNIGIDAGARLPVLDENAKLSAQLQLNTEPDGAPTIDGQVAIDSMDVSALAGLPGLPALSVNATAAVSGTVPEDMTFDCTGEVRLGAAQAVRSTLAATVQVQQSDVRIAALSLEGDALLLETAANITGGKTFDINMASAEVRAPVLRAALTAMPESPVALAVSDEATVTLRGVRFGNTGEGNVWRIGDGELDWRGLDVLGPEGKPLFSHLRGEARVEENTLQVSRLEAEGLALEGAVSPGFADSSVAITASGRATVSRAQLEPWMDLGAVDALDATLVLERLALRLPAEPGLLETLELAAHVERVAATTRVPGAAEPLRSTISGGKLAYANRTFTLEGLRGEGVELGGKVALEPETNVLDLRLAGTVDLGSALVAAFLPDGPVGELAGTLSLSRAHARYRPGAGSPEDLELEGALEGGGATVQVPGFQDRLSQARASFKTTPEHIEAEMRLSSEMFGELQWDGTYAVAGRHVRGVLWLDVPHAVANLAPEGRLGSLAGSALQPYRQSTFEVEAVLPGGTGEQPYVSLARQGEPPVQARADLVQDSGGVRPDSIQASATLPLEGLAQALPPALDVSGAALLSFERAPGETGYTARVDLQPAGFQVGSYVSKAPGQSASVLVQGGGPESVWAPEAVTVALLGESIRAGITGEGVHAEDIALGLAAWTPLLPEQASADGRITGSFASAGPRLDLRFQDVALALSEEASVRDIDGDVRLREGVWTVEHVTIRGADSDCTINAGLRGGAWQGEVTGSQLNLNALRVFWDAAQAFQSTYGETAPPDENAPAEAVPAEAAPQGLSGRVTVNLGEVLFRRGQVTNLRTAVAFSPGQVTLSDIEMQPYSGSITGNVDIMLPRSAQPGTARVRLNFKEADLRLLDDMLFEEPREVRGIATGLADVTFPLGTEAPPYAGLDGLVTYNAQDGSYGKLGVATKLLSALRATEVIRLRVPTLRDEGLVFTSTDGRFPMKQGKVTVEKLTIKSKSYAVDASGSADLAQDKLDVKVRVNLLQSVTGLVEKVPIVGGAVGVVKGAAQMRVHLTGSPFAPEVRGGVTPVRGAESAVEESAEKAVSPLESVVKGAAGILGGGEEE